MIKIHVNGVRATLVSRDESAAAHWQEAKAALAHNDITLSIETVYRFSTEGVDRFHVASVQFGIHAFRDYMVAMCGDSGEVVAWGQPELLRPAEGEGVCHRCVMAVAEVLT